MAVMVVVVLALIAVPGGGAFAEENGATAPVPGADAPFSPTTGSDALDVGIADFLTDEQIAAAAARLQQRDAGDWSSADFGDVLYFASWYLGWEYVWGGKDPVRDGGFDCSGYICWVYNNVCGTGINGDYTNAATLYEDFCTPLSSSEARPGDVVFFRGTYGPSSYISHVGIYCGEGVMIDAGDPIGFHSIYGVTQEDGSPAPIVFGRLVTLSSSFIDLADVTVTVADQPWTGSPRAPKPVVEFAGRVLRPGIDYVYSYSNNDAIGTASVHIVGSGLYVGSRTVTFSIYNDMTHKYGFWDLDWDAWYAEDGIMDYILSNNIIQGYAGEPLFGPYDSLTRGQAVTILWRLEGSPAVAGQVFGDVDPVQYYASAVNWAYEAGVAHGYAGTNAFMPDAEVTREELATLIANYAAVKGLATDEGTDLSQFPDVAKVSPWAEDSLSWCVSQGIVSGKGTTLGDGSPLLDPQAEAWRASMAKMVTILARDLLAV